jgi:hypothetical protein
VLKSNRRSPFDFAQGELSTPSAAADLLRMKCFAARAGLRICGGSCMLGRSGEEGFGAGDGCRHAVGREAGEEGLAVALSSDSGAEEDKDAAVFRGADETAKALP